MPLRSCQVADKEINMAEIKGKCGGKRWATSTHSLTGKVYYYKADKELVSVLDNQENRNRFINDAVREKSEKEGLL